MKPVIFHPEAELEYLGVLTYYAGVRESLGKSVYHHMDRLLVDVGRRPQFFRMFDPPARRHFGSRFPYSIIYLDQPERIWIVAVSHFKQRPGYWKERLN